MRGQIHEGQDGGVRRRERSPDGPIADDGDSRIGARMYGARGATTSAGMPRHSILGGRRITTTNEERVLTKRRGIRPPSPAAAIPSSGSINGLPLDVVKVGIMGENAFFVGSCDGREREREKRESENERMREREFRML